MALTQPLAVVLRREPGSPPLAREPAQVGDFADVASEAWRDGCLRAGYPDAPLAETPMALSPILVSDSDTRCVGFDLELTLPNGSSTHRHFTFYSLRHVADRAANSLVEAGELKPGQSFTFEVVVEPRVHPPPRTVAAPVPFTVTLRHAPLPFLRVPLRPLLERARPVALLDAEVFPVFYTEEAFAKAEVCARRGGQYDPPVETGCVLFGSLAACADSGEFFSIIHDVIEVKDAAELKFSLSYSSRTWTHLQAVQKARQAAFPERADRLQGQAHGHSFTPHDGKACSDCDKRATCMLTSAFASLDDQAWHRAVFARQPWALCHIFGLSPCGEHVHQLFGLKDGRLQPRGFYLLPNFTFD